MVKKYFKYLFLFLFGLILLIPKDTFAASVSTADLNILWTSNVTTGTQNLTYNNYTLGNMQQFGTDGNIIYHIVRWGGGVNFSGTSGEPFVTARVKFRIRAVPSQIQGEIPYFNCMTYSAGMSNATATKESSTAIHDSGGTTTGYDIVCAYSYKTSTPYYQFFGVDGRDGHYAINGTYASASTYFSYEILDMTMTDNSGTQALIIQNQTIINQNDTMINNQNETNNKLDDLNDNLTSSDIDEQNTEDNIDDFMNNNDVSSPTDVGIQDLITLPIKLITGLLSSINSSCNNITLVLLGKDIVFPCINLSNYLGVAWNIIDLIISCVLVFNFAKKLKEIFINFTSLETNKGDLIE